MVVMSYVLRGHCKSLFFNRIQMFRRRTCLPHHRHLPQKNERVSFIFLFVYIQHLSEPFYYSPLFGLLSWDTLFLYNTPPLRRIGIVSIAKQEYQILHNIIINNVALNDLIRTRISSKL